MLFLNTLAIPKSSSSPLSPCHNHPTACWPCSWHAGQTNSNSVTCFLFFSILPFRAAAETYSLPALSFSSKMLITLSSSFCLNTSLNSLNNESKNPKRGHWYAPYYLVTTKRLPKCFGSIKASCMVVVLHFLSLSTSLSCIKILIR